MRVTKQALLRKWPNIELSEESWDCATRRGIAVIIADPEKPEINYWRHAVAFSAYEVIRPPVFGEPEIVRLNTLEEIAEALRADDDDESDWTLTVQADEIGVYYLSRRLVTDPGESRKLSTAQLAARARRAYDLLDQWLRQMVRLGQVLTMPKEGRE